MIVIAGYLNFTADQTKPVKQEAAAETAEKIREEKIGMEKLASDLCRYKRTGLQREGTATDVSESEYLPCNTV